MPQKIRARQQQESSQEKHLSKVKGSERAKCIDELQKPLDEFRIQNL